MYKIKSVSRGSATIKFPKQAEMNYQAVCFLNEIQNRFLIPYTVTLKHSKVLVKFENQSGTAYRDIMAGHTELIAAVRTTAELLKQLYGIFEQCSAAKLDPRGIVFRADCICIERDGAVKVMYAPGFDFDPSHSLQNLFSEIHGFFGGNENAYNDLYTSFSVFNSSGSEGANRYLNDLISNKLGGTPSPVSNEGETTILSSRVAPVSNEGETTILSSRVANVSNEGETTVLSPNMNMRGFAPEEDDYNENSTVLMTEENGGMLEQEPVNPVFDDDYNENSTVLMTDDNDEIFDEQDSDHSISDYITGIKTKYGDENQNESVSSDTLSESESPKDERYFEHGGQSTEENSEAEDFSESETTMPGLHGEIDVNPTLIGAEGLAKAMADSGLESKADISQYDTVLLSGDVVERTAFFIRFVNSQAIYITKNYFTMGSGRDMDYVIQGNALISRYHATVVIENGKFYIIDNNSTNKVYVDGKEAVPFEKNEIDTGSKVVLANEIFDFYVK